jgi:hypothetical protein
MTLRTYQLAEAGAVTIWWVPFKVLSACSGGVCDQDDVPLPGVGPAAPSGVLFTAGHVISGGPS